MFKRRNEVEVVQKRRTIFNIPSDEAKQYLSKIVEDVNVIIHNDKFIEATKRVKLPDNATIKDFERIVTRVAPNKIHAILSLFIDECFDEVRRILASVFVMDFEIYRKKTLNEMCEDIASLNKDEVVQIIRFFLR